MPLPKRRHSKQRGRKRRTHYKATFPALTECGNCGEAKMLHHICPSCGFYRGEQILEGKEA
ncbi:MAG: 50S ribosomal protein L32 [bacterium]|nr:50S ribosomal protein L32 [bacterium]